MEEWAYDALLKNGFAQTWPSVDPKRPPEPGTFWYNSRVFNALRGSGGKRLECDFMIGFHQAPTWLELHGIYHYKSFLNRKSPAEHQRHDALRRQFAVQTLPNVTKAWANVKFEEVLCFRFSQWQTVFKRCVREHNDLDSFLEHHISVPASKRQKLS